MKKIFLTSSIGCVAKDIARHIPKSKGENLVFITTASEPVKGDLSWREEDRNALVKVGFRVSDFTFTGKSKTEIKKMLGKFDVMCVEGGNPYYLLQQIQKSNCADVICDRVNKGMIYIGSSAGSMVAGPDLYPARHTDAPEDFIRLKSYAGLGLVNFLVHPHWGSDYWKKLYLGKRSRNNYTEEHKFFWLTDNQYLHVEDDWLQFIDLRLDQNK